MAMQMLETSLLQKIIYKNCSCYYWM